jgi:hypothetical protein
VQRRRSRIKAYSGKNLRNVNIAFSLNTKTEQGVFPLSLSKLSFIELQNIYITEGRIL